ncbi:pyridoxal 5'-phosphate synthase glutaminase subunit PdxT [Tomitella fengzijianii]|uniref:Pyridoxal 5'-phosphate synthase subunit PdxT n=1 Tax=Tomitella fengzijianii TaxID=2597660 RepID=A0A516X3D3_9ACTN|nr:pyridoxal 5'-phosphate synthase glutaminase subunit PdxT [Tomitella fengzijianii]QDQ97567.1 pyridoxal 5'-phosphate synthase glutaminase subunit PdxT [Tomitella fengzijianii]
MSTTAGTVRSDGAVPAAPATPGPRRTPPRIGVLALQGDVREHLAALRTCGADAVPVRTAEDLDSVAGLVFPGGESTAMSRLLRVFDMIGPVQRAVADGLPVYGSCAGMILLAAEVLDTREDAVNFGALDVTVRRNAFGRQVDSFEEDLRITGIAGDPVRAVFIRAPWIERVGPGVEVLAAVDRGGAERAVAVRQGAALATSFHPEMGEDLRIHGLFVDMVRAAA